MSSLKKSYASIVSAKKAESPVRRAKSPVATRAKSPPARRAESAKALREKERLENIKFIKEAAEKTEAASYGTAYESAMYSPDNLIEKFIDKVKQAMAQAFPNNVELLGLGINSPSYRRILCSEVMFFVREFKPELALSSKHLAIWRKFDKIRNYLGTVTIDFYVMQAFLDFFLLHEFEYVTIADLIQWKHAKIAETRQHRIRALELKRNKLVKLNAEFEAMVEPVMPENHDPDADPYSLREMAQEMIIDFLTSSDSLDVHEFNELRERYRRAKQYNDELGAYWKVEYAYTAKKKELAELITSIEHATADLDRE